MIRYYTQAAATATNQTLKKNTMEQVEKELKSFKWTNESIVEVLLNSNNKAELKDILKTIRKYTTAIVIHYSGDMDSTAKVSIGAKTIAVA